MSFRRNSDRSIAWRQWINLRRDEFTTAGVPTEIFSDELRWWRFVENGGLDWETGWRVELLFARQADALYQLVEREFHRPGLNSCLRVLDEIRRKEERTGE
jgi:hypothetical protein